MRCVILLVVFSLGCAPDLLTADEYIGGTSALDASAPDGTSAPDLPQSDLDGPVDGDEPDLANPADADDDVGMPDTGPEDTGPVDTGPVDTGPDDTGPEDTATMDTGPEDTGPDDIGVPDVDDSGPDACLPDCAGKQCGDNGCGGLCGFCEVGQDCNELFQCANECVKQCFQKFCGPDNCGGTCGTCEVGFECGPDGKCYDVACVPDCDGKLCGDDGCGNSCGTCADGDLCEENQCVDGPCTGIPTTTGKCEDGVAYTCVDGAATVANCNSVDDKICGWNPSLGHFACIAEPDCIPNCDGKDCGEDGCGGLCGLCPSNWPCANAICQPTAGGGCGYFNAIGTCDDETLWYCDNSLLFSQDCLSTNQTCLFSPATNSNQCLD